MMRLFERKKINGSNQTVTGIVFSTFFMKTIETES